MTKNKKHKTKY